MNDKKPLEFRFWKALVPMTDLLGEFSTPRNDVQKYSDLNLRQMKAIKLVWMIQEENPEGTTLKNLAEMMKLTPGTVSELVDSLVRRKLLARLQNQEDRREVRITLTEESTKVINVCTQNMDRVSKMLLDSIPEADREPMINNLETIFKKLIQLKEETK